MQRLDAFFYAFYVEIVDGKYKVVTNDRLKQEEEHRIQREYTRHGVGSCAQDEYVRLLKESLTADKKDATRVSRNGAKTNNES